MITEPFEEDYPHCRYLICIKKLWIDVKEERWNGDSYIFYTNINMRYWTFWLKWPLIASSLKQI